MGFKKAVVCLESVPDSIKASCLAFLLCLPLVALNSIPENDCAARYAPMAEAFASGQWKFAFHPMIPPLFPLTSGLIAAVFGLSGFTAAKLASALFFALAAVLLYHVFERVFDRKTAFFGTLLYVLCSHLLRLASSGLRETAKCLVFFLAVYGIVLVFQNQKRYQGYGYCALGSAGLALLRGDCLLYALLFLSACLALELFGKGRLRFPFRSVSAVLMFILLISPWLIYEYRVIGYPVPETRIAAMLTRAEDKLGLDWIYNKQAEIRLPAKQERRKVEFKSGPSSFKAPMKYESEDSPAAQSPHIPMDALVPPQKITNQDDTLSEFMSALIKGFYPYFSLFAVPVVFFRIRKKNWTGAETVILIILLGHALLQVLQVAVGADRFYVSRRYLITVAPLAFGWSILGMTHALKFLENQYAFVRNKRLQTVVLTLLILFLISDGAHRTIKFYISPQKKETKESITACSTWIRENYGGPYHYVECFPRCAYRYDPGRKPVILSIEPAVKYFGQIPPQGKNMASGFGTETSEQCQVDYVVVSSDSPEIDVNQYPGLEKTFSSGTRYNDLDIYSLN